jgi:vitamin B12 transporter
MKKSLIALAIANTFVSTLTFAEQASSEQATAAADETIVITANRTEQNKFDVLAAVDVFDRDAIETLQPLSVADLLSRAAGINITQQGTAAHKTSVFVRGTNSDHILILVNGVRVGSATLGNKELSSIPVQLIERVEIVRGPRAALWGADAMGGVVQIFTRQLDAGDGQVGLKLGSDNLWQGYGAIGFGTEDHNYTLSASAEASDGYDVIKPNNSNPYAVDQSDDDGYNRESVALNGLSKFSDIYSLEVNAQLDQGTTEIDANTDNRGDETSYENYNLLLRNHWQLEQVYLQLGLSTSSDKSEDNYDDYQDFAPASLFETQRNQISGLVQLPLAEQTEVTLGGEWYNEKVTSNTIYNETKRDVNAVFVTGRHSIDQIKLEASVRRDEVGDLDSEITYQLGAGYQFTDKLLVALTHGTAFKAPSFNDLWYPWGGNPDLISETADSTEVLTRFQADNYSVEVSVYQTNIDNLIEWAPVDPSAPYGPWQPFNIDNAEITGAEATITAHVFSLDNRLTLSQIKAEDKSTGKQLPRRPKFSGNYIVTYPGNGWDASFEINHQGERSDSKGGVMLSSYTLINLRASYQVTADLTLLGAITNAGDRDYQTANTYQGAERGYNLTVDYRF